MQFARGQLNYITATMALEVSFPEGNVVCDYCDFCKSENAGTRFRCSQTGEILPFHNKTVGRRCPLTIPKTMIEREEE